MKKILLVVVLVNNNNTGSGHTENCMNGGGYLNEHRFNEIMQNCIITGCPSSNKSEKKRAVCYSCFLIKLHFR